MKIIHILILAIFLQGCGFLQKVKEPFIPADKVVRINEEALQPCKPLQEDVVVLTFDDVLQQYANISTMYGVCAGKQNISIDLLKQFSSK